MTNLSTATIEELEAELVARYATRKAQERAAAIARIATLNLRGFTVKDVVVTIDRPQGEDLRFSFALRRDGKEHDFYYGWQDWRDGEPEMVPHDWWPAHLEGSPAGEWINDALQFIPPGFHEESENSYAFSGMDDEAIEVLRAAGYEMMQTPVGPLDGDES